MGVCMCRYNSIISKAELLLQVCGRAWLYHFLGGRFLPYHVHPCVIMCKEAYSSKHSCVASSVHAALTSVTRCFLHFLAPLFSEDTSSPRRPACTALLPGSSSMTVEPGRYLVVFSKPEVRFEGPKSTSSTPVAWEHIGWIMVDPYREKWPLKPSI